MSNLNPITQPRDYVLMAGKKTPGITDIIGAGSIREWDKRKGYGNSGAFSVFIGRDLSTFTIRLRLYTVEHWEAWHAFRPLIERMPKRRMGAGKNSGAIDVWHPHLEAVDIRAVAITKLSIPEQTADGEWTINIEVIEYRMPHVALVKPDGPDSPTPVDPWDEKIDALEKQTQRLLGVE